MNQKIFILSKVVVSLAFSWAVLTAWVQFSDKAIEREFGAENSGPQIQILFKADPIYNLDEQICMELSSVLEANGCRVLLSTYASEPPVSEETDAIVFCANTYNWAPDWATQEFIRKNEHLKAKMAIAILLGSGSTYAAREIFENSISLRNMDLIGTEDFWLLRPNDETRLNEDNVAIAREQIKLKAQQWFDLIELKMKLNASK
jgi:hypothetical protein